MTYLQPEEGTKVPARHRLLTLRPSHFLGSASDSIGECSGDPLLELVKQFSPDEVVGIIRFVG